MAVLNSLTSPGSRRVYQFAINQFITWYCSEPRLAFNRLVVVRYRMYLESRRLAANTINQQLAAVRRLAHEAADAGLLSPDLAAGISRVKGVKQLGQRSGNWLSLEQSSEVLSRARGDLMREKRDYAMLALLFGCGLRRSELVGLEMSDVQKRQEHWAIVDLIGKGGHIRTVPIPEMGEAGTRRVDGGCWDHRRKDLSKSEPDRKGLGQSDLPERGLVRGQRLLRKGGAGAYRAPRSAANVREVVPFEWRGDRTNSISARPRLGADDRTIPGL
jgi:site-specific recombinase XerD